MGIEQAVLLRRLSPLAAVLALLAPPAARAASDSPDPAPGATVLQPDPAPVARAKPVRTAAAPAPRRPAVVVRAVVVTPVRAVTARTQAAPPPPERTSKPVTAKPKPKPRTHKRASALAANFDLPPVLGPAFLDVPRASRTPAVLAAVALLAAALTAGSGAGLVFSWSRR
jgi:hypothetical protein